MEFIKTKGTGILLCFIIAIPSFYMGKLFPVIGGPVFAILAGMVITLFIKEKGGLKAGITFTSKKILQYAVILLGFGMNLSDILAKGSQSLPIIISTISTSLIVSFIMYKLMKMPSKISTLVGVGSSICGGSAIAATAPVIEASDEEIAQSISVIFLFNILAALLFPMLGSLLHLSNEGFGIFAGSAINDTSSVTAAASSWDGMYGAHTLEAATIVKLTRTLAIIPITLVLAIYRSKKAKEESESTFNFKKVFPFFIIFFVLASIITTVFNLSPEITAPLKQLSKFFIVMAMSAIGLNTNIIHLIKTGGKPIFMGFCCWVAIACVCLSMQYMLGLW
ncbi:MAG: YeiH family putative sulfate export transporter [Erysipelotrichia bacterium]|nr:YeiH family putative sulfate export transporter [Erysipelotrichia bacterium]